MYRVLVIEDEDPLRRIITLNLARRGYSVVEADSVATANEALDVSTAPFDLILLDVNLPDQTGWDVLRHLNEARHMACGADGQPEQTPKVIVMTALRPAQCRQDEFRPAAVLLKPFPIDALLRLIARVLDQRAPGASAEESTSSPDVSERTDSDAPSFLAPRG
jgi:CheY-like chemotaxis protein